MKTLTKWLFRLLSYVLVAGVGFAGGLYMLPIWIQPEAPSRTEIVPMKDTATYKGTAWPNLKGSDFLHWGRGKVYIGDGKVAFLGELSPGPDYKLYLAPTYARDEAEFEAVKGQSAYIGEVKTFKNFALPLPAGVDPANYKAIVVWCEAFSEFITAAEYRASDAGV